jgi:hypothetical protein
MSMAKGVPPLPLKLWADDEGHPDTWEVDDLIEKFVQESKDTDAMSSAWDRHGLTQNYDTPMWRKAMSRLHVMRFSIMFAMERGRQQ